MVVVAGATGVTRRSSNDATSGCYDADSEEGRDNSDGDHGDGDSQRVWLAKEEEGNVYREFADRLSGARRKNAEKFVGSSPTCCQELVESSPEECWKFIGSSLKEIGSTPGVNREHAAIRQLNRPEHCLPDFFLCSFCLRER
ncbi:hypothetical protein B296_00021759 [Ensete ventricosum]|uniref:Uncharacterized protein n=1 Tax=Ensete ventricosum TaxID=4639 RepID=A0A426YDU9_ENSVE|nr:hypothetical protein B296_00021759 [Ensete ventricosum]